MKEYNPGFLEIYLRMFVKPQSTFVLLLNDPRRLQYGFFAFLIPALGYTLFYILAWNAGDAPYCLLTRLPSPTTEKQRFRTRVILGSVSSFKGIS